MARTSIREPFADVGRARLPWWKIRHAGQFVLFAILLAGCFEPGGAPIPGGDPGSFQQDERAVIPVSVADTSVALLLSEPVARGASIVVKVVDSRAVDDRTRTLLFVGVANADRGLVNFSAVFDVHGSRPLVSGHVAEKGAAVGDSPDIRSVAGDVARPVEFDLGFDGAPVAIILTADGLAVSFEVSSEPPGLLANATRLDAMEPLVRSWSSLNPEDMPSRTEVHAGATGFLQADVKFEVTAPLGYVLAFTSGTQGSLTIESALDGSCAHGSNLVVPGSMAAALINGGPGGYRVSTLSAAPDTLGGNYLDVMSVEIPFWETEARSRCLH